MKVMVIGASGFLGQEIVQHFQKQGVSVIAASRNALKLQKHLSYETECISYSDFDSFSKMFSIHQITCVIFAANDYGRSSGITDLLKCNLEFLTLILDGALKSGCVSRFMYSGTAADSEYSLYAATKNAATPILKYYAANGVDVTHFRIHNIYGPFDKSGSFLSSAIRNISKNKVISCSPGMQVRDFIYVEDIASAYLTVLHATCHSYQECDVGTGVPVTIQSYLKTATDIAKSNLENLRFGASRYRINEQMKMVANPKTLKSLGWKPQWDLHDGLATTIKHHQENSI